MEEKISNSDIEKMLKSELDDYVPDILDKIKRTPVIVDSKPLKKRFVFNKLQILFASLALLFGGSTISIGSVYASEYQTVTIDVNPSIELVINRFDRVIDVNYNNEDAANSFKSLNLKHRSIKVAIDQCLLKLENDGYLNKDKESNFLVISGFDKKRTMNDDRMDTLYGYVNDFMVSEHIKYMGLKNVVTKDEKKRADDNGFTFGQQAIFDLILLEHPDMYDENDLRNLPPEQLKDIYYDLHHEPPKDGYRPIQ